MDWMFILFPLLVILMGLPVGAAIFIGRQTYLLLDHYIGARIWA